jgi:hypothetical protein
MQKKDQLFQKNIKKQMAKPFFEIVLENISSFSQVELNVLMLSIDKEINPSFSKLNKDTLEQYKTLGKLSAVKYYKDKSGLGLKESKDYVEELILQNPEYKYEPPF